MKRKLNTLELRRLKDGGSQQNESQEQIASPSKKRPGGAVGSPKRAKTARGHGGSAKKEDPREHQNLSREEIALMLMEVSEKIDRCFNFDLQKWLNRYESLRGDDTNFPEAAMLIVSAAQIYGRKVDYLEDIILHMDHDQKGREESKEEGGQQKEDKPVGRKRAARFQPQSLSDCFSDLEFTFVDKKRVPIGSLVNNVERIGVDRRNKFQQMQELCNELRTMPTKQRRQEILNRLRDEANIPPIMSSHSAARKNQIMDLESGETIGTRYDFQIYLNFIDVRTGSLIPEHDLKRFFQRCDVIDYLFEQQECERERCERNGKPTPEKVFPLKPREFKMYIPPDYLKNKYRIQIDDTSDFDNALHQAKSSNYQSDPILQLMVGKFGSRGKHSEPEKDDQLSPNATLEIGMDNASFSNVLSSSTIEQNLEATSSSETQVELFDDSGHFDDSHNSEQETVDIPVEANSEVSAGLESSALQDDNISETPLNSSQETGSSDPNSTLTSSNTSLQTSSEQDPSSSTEPSLVNSLDQPPQESDPSIIFQVSPIGTPEESDSSITSQVSPVPTPQESEPAISSQTSAVQTPQESEPAISSQTSAVQTSQESDPSTTYQPPSIQLPDASSEDTLTRSKETSPEPELMALENQQPEAGTATAKSDQDQQLSQSRLSLEDEGIGADRESLGPMSPLSFARTPSMDKLSDCIGSSPEPTPFFGGGCVITMTGGGSMRTITLKPALLSLNALKIPECHLRKHLLFALPAEYKKMKMDVVRKTSDKGKDLFSLTLYSLNPKGSKKNSEWLKRPATPEPEDFFGFDEFAEILNGPHGKCLYSLAPISEGQRSNFSRASTPESEFFGFESNSLCDSDVVVTSVELAPEPVAETVENKEEPLPRVPIAETINNEAEPIAEPASSIVDSEPVMTQQQPAVPEEPEKPQSASQQSTPTRTLSRDSGISDDQNDRRGSRSKEGTPEPLAPLKEVFPPSEPADGNDSSLSPSAEPESALTSEKYIQSVADAKELIEKVNNWHRKLRPILIQSEQRNHFDIHAYGTEIIDSFGPELQGKQSIPVISFAQVMENKQDDCTARYFLSMLMLANTDNVQIVTNGQDPNRLTGKDDIKLRLLSRKRHHQEMESMGDRIPCDNTPSGKGTSGKVKSPRGKKRKKLIEADEGLEDEDDELAGITRLRDDDDLDHDFLEKIRRIYPDINSEETVKKRIAFHRGMRRCAYGLSTDKQAGAQEDTIQEPPPPPFPPPAETEGVLSQTEKTPTEENDLDEILSVDLLTNEAMMAPMVVDQDPCCSKSIFSTAESGYESMLGGVDC